MDGGVGSQMGNERMTDRKEGQAVTHPLQLSVSFDLLEIRIEVT